jgi:hypothetical protein
VKQPGELPSHQLRPLKRATSSIEAGDENGGGPWLLAARGTLVGALQFQPGFDVTMGSKQPSG